MKKLHKFTNYWRESIAARLLIKVFAIYLIVTILVTLLHMYSQYSVTKDDVSIDLTVFHSSFEPGISISLWNQDELAFESEMHAIYNVPQIVGAKVIDTNGEVVGGIGNVTDDVNRPVFYDPDTLKRIAGKRPETIGLFKVEKDVFYKDVDLSYKVGTLVLYSSSGFVFSRVQYEYIFIIINALIKTLALWLIVLWQSKPVISKPIHEFSKHLESTNIENIADIKLDLKTEGIRELEMLDNAFDQMANNLKNAIISRDEAQKELHDSESRLKHALAVSNEGIWDWDIKNNEIFYNHAFFTMLGYSHNDFPQNKNSWFNLIHPDDKEKCQDAIEHCLSGYEPGFKIEYRLCSKDKKYLWILAKGKIVEHDYFGSPIRFVGTHTDISKIKEKEERLQKLASYDPLTNLANRTMFTDILKNAIAETQRKPCKHAVLFLDLDRFKTINDSLGHTIGDQLLVGVSLRLEMVLRESDFVARLGGDEFTILLKNIVLNSEASEVAERIIDVLKRPFNLSGHQVVVGPSIGIVLYPDHGKTTEELLKNADTAMYISKRSGGCCYNFFNEKMTNEVHVRLETEAALREAIEQNNIILHYQPKFSLTSGHINGLEALARWKNNDELVSPAHFIPLAEETGLIIPMGKIIMKKAFIDTKHWIQDKGLSFRVAINISAIQFRQQDLLKIIDELLEETQLAAEHIELELTEAAVMEDIEYALNIMNKIKNRGINLALDDFGTGYSSLNYLKKFPIDTLKIDRSFIHDMEFSKENENIVKTIIELAHHLKLNVVAEGVEKPSQTKLLTAMKCDSVQGFLYSKPIDSKLIPEFIETDTNILKTKIKNFAS